MRGRDQDGSGAGRRGVEVFVALGSNIGHRVENLKRALAALEEILQLTDRSSVYDTAPVHVTEQPRFLNMVVRGETDLPASAFLTRLKAIEAELGRHAGERYGPRIIDLDILLYGEAVVDLPDLTIPHPRMTEREFVLRPLADIAPGRRHPVTGRTVIEMLADLSGGDVRPVRTDG